MYKAIDRENGDMVAMKKMRMEAWTEGVPATALREISVLKEVDHPNVVRWGGRQCGLVCAAGGALKLGRKKHAKPRRARSLPPSPGSRTCSSTRRATCTSSLSCWTAT